MEESGAEVSREGTVRARTRCPLPAAAPSARARKRMRRPVFWLATSALSTKMAHSCGTAPGLHRTSPVSARDSAEHISTAGFVISPAQHWVQG